MKDGAGDINVRAGELTDAAVVAEIYNCYISGSAISFEEEPVTGPEITRRMGDVRSKGLPWLVAEKDGRVAGYAYGTPWKNRSAYRFSAEVTVYVAPGLRGGGIGSALYDRLIPMLQAQGIHSALGTIALPNEVSVALHENFGFRKVGEFREVGFKFERWIDVGYWQRML